MGFKIQNGKITMTTPQGDIDISLDYIKADMQQAIKPIRRKNSFYVLKIREYIKELDRGSFDAIPNVQAKLKSFFGASEKGVADCCRRWVELLQMVHNFGRPRPATDSTQEAAIDGRSV